MFHTSPDIFVNGFFFSRFEINVIPICSLGPVQTPLHSCAEPNWVIKYGKRAASESVWYGSFNLVRQSLSHYSTLERQVIHTAFFSCAESNAYIMIIYKSSHKSLLEIKIRFDTRCAVWIRCHANVAPKSNQTQLGSAHEWSGVWTGP